MTLDNEKKAIAELALGKRMIDAYPADRGREAIYRAREAADSLSDDSPTKARVYSESATLLAEHYWLEGNATMAIEVLDETHQYLEKLRQTHGAILGKFLVEKYELCRVFPKEALPMRQQQQAWLEDAHGLLLASEAPTADLANCVRHLATSVRYDYAEMFNIRNPERLFQLAQLLKSLVRQLDPASDDRARWAEMANEYESDALMILDPENGLIAKKRIVDEQLENAGSPKETLDSIAYSTCKFADLLLENGQPTLAEDYYLRAMHLRFLHTKHQSAIPNWREYLPEAVANAIDNIAKQWVEQVFGSRFSDQSGSSDDASDDGIPGLLLELMGLSRAYLHQGKFALAEAVLDRLIADFDNEDNRDNLSMAECLIGKSKCRAGLGDSGNAEPLLLEALAICRNCLPKHGKHFNVASHVEYALVELAAYYDSVSNRTRADECYLELMILRAEYGL